MRLSQSGQWVFGGFGNAQIKKQRTSIYRFTVAGDRHHTHIAVGGFAAVEWQRQQYAGTIRDDGTGPL